MPIGLRKTPSRRSELDAELMTPGGIAGTGSILDKIVADKRHALELRKKAESFSALEEMASAFDEQWPLLAAIQAPGGAAAGQPGPAIIAEIKKASPSKGVLAPGLDYLAVARDYAGAGAAGISVLTEENYFLGSLDWMREVRRLLSVEIPGKRPSVLRKDFLVESYELAQARAFGADNVLLIVALLEAELLRDLIAEAAARDLGALVEVHNEAEAERAVRAGAKLFGINNRDLHTFKVDLGVSERIRPLLPQDALVVGESGVHTSGDVARLEAAGVQAILVGEAFMTADDISAKMNELRVSKPA